ncbi:hypothetical protein FNF31_00520 [Cafeteria roenbergensis]|uniref:Glycosyl transferase family 1 domain-containing protein n=1 Tax=Cafeteria roenbergensis TaxID=33653 RepID=A0A5A8DWC1_CAFRO|nr:hypothetical protein FNF28_06363 [Cafeteria roenbergensis]KAA0168021.1 hypothetical protein FNF31_00520 [Cafeteria roenbergensis]
MLSMEWLGPLFSGNGIYGRSLAQSLQQQGGCVAVGSALADASPDATVATQAAADSEVGAFAGKAPCGGKANGPLCSTRDGSLVVGVPAEASTWSRLDLLSPWQAFADGFGPGTAAADVLMRFAPHTVIAVDWHGALAYEAFAAAWRSACSSGAPAERPKACKARAGAPPPMVYMNFRLFSGTKTFASNSSSLAAFAALEGRAASLAQRTIALSRIDASRLAALAARAEELGEGVAPWLASDRDAASSGWWHGLLAWSRTPLGAAAAESLRPALDGVAPAHAGGGASSGRWTVLLPTLRRAMRARAQLDPLGLVAGLVKDRQPYARPGSLHGDSETQQHDQLPWLEMFDRWVVDDSKRAATDDADAWLASHEAVIQFRETDSSLQERALIQEDRMVKNKAGTLPEDMPMDSVVQSGPLQRPRRHKFQRPPLLRYPVEVHPIHPLQRDAHRELSAASGGPPDPRAGKKEDGEAAQPGYKSGVTFDTQGGKPSGGEQRGAPAAEHEQGGGGGGEEDEADGRRRLPMLDDAQVAAGMHIEWTYGNVTDEIRPLLPPRWMADAGYPIEENIPDKYMTAVRSVRVVYDGLMVEERGGPANASNATTLGVGADGESARMEAGRAAAAGLHRPRERLLVPARRLITWCSRVSSEKNPLLLPHALRLISDLLEETGFIAAACISGPDEELNQRVEDAFLAAHPRTVLLGGFLSPARMADVFARTALYVHTAEYEAFGMTPVEAAAFGAPTLAHEPACGAGDVCVSERPGALPPAPNASRPTESLFECSERLSPVRRGDLKVLSLLAERADQEAADAARSGADKAELKRLNDHHDRIHDALGREMQADQETRRRGVAAVVPTGLIEVEPAPLTAGFESPVQPPPLPEGRAMADSNDEFNPFAVDPDFTRSATPLLQASRPAPSVGSLELLRPELGLAYGTNMSAEPWQLAQSLGRVICLATLRLPWSESNLTHANILDKHFGAVSIPWRPAAPFPASAGWAAVGTTLQSRALTSMEARTGANGQAAKRLLECRERLAHGFDGPLSFGRFLADCGCTGFLADHLAHAQPLGRGERIGAAVRDHDPSAALAAQSDHLLRSGIAPHGPIPHPGCVGLAARQASLAWDDAVAGKALLKATVKAAKAAAAGSKKAAPAEAKP